MRANAYRPDVGCKLHVVCQISTIQRIDFENGLSCNYLDQWVRPAAKFAFADTSVETVKPKEFKRHTSGFQGSVVIANGAIVMVADSVLFPGISTRWWLLTDHGDLSSISG